MISFDFIQKKLLIFQFFIHIDTLYRNHIIFSTSLFKQIINKSNIGKMKNNQISTSIEIEHQTIDDIQQQTRAFNRNTNNNR